MASIDHLHQESLTLRVKDHSDMLSAQYLVNCLEEDHVSHGITIQEPRPRPMKETLHSRHLSTVLPRLGSNRMESLQNLHTHAVDSAIQLQGNNRVLKKRRCCLPTPMALASGESPMFPLVVHQPASPSIWPAVQSLRRGLSTNPGATMWCVCGCS